MQNTLMSTLRLWAPLFYCMSLVAYAQVPQSVQSCGPIVWESPARNEPSITTTRPTLRWQPIVAAKRYRVRLRSQIPNGEILHDIDTVTNDNQFTPAAALAEQLANIRVQIIPECDPQFAALVPPDFRSGEAFLLDPRATCETPRWVLRAEATANADAPTVLVLRWQQSASARHYELTLFSGAEARVLSRQTLHGTSYPLSAASSQNSLVASLRARCENGWSDVAQIVVQPAFSR